jgi:hypothetical protein
MGSLNKTDVRAKENLLSFTGKAFFLRKILAQNQTGELMGSESPVVPLGMNVPVAAVIVMEKGRVKSGGIKENRIRPGTLNAGSCGKEIRDILHGTHVPVADIRINQIKKTVAVRKTRCPNAAGEFLAVHIEQTLFGKRRRNRSPVH